jgi:hypothetical protein
MRQEDCGFEDSLGCKVRPCFKKQEQKHTQAKENKRDLIL